jgi:hypothetical protein
METYIAITITDGADGKSDELLDTLNRLIMSPLPKSIMIYDLSKLGVCKEMRSIFNEYRKYGVLYNRIKLASSRKTEQERFNLGIAESLLHFNHIKSKKFDTYVHISQNMIFGAHDLALLVNNSRLYNAVSPIVESTNGLEMWNAIFDRFGVTFSKSSQAPSFFVTGQIEDSYTLNPKCFGLSNRYAKRLKNFTLSDREPVEYLNGLIYDNTDELPKIDTSLFVHENLY